MSSYASLVNQSSSYRIALHYERKAHKSTKSKSKKILKTLQQQLDDKQNVIETLIERNVELESKFWDLLKKCPAMNQENDDYDDEEDDEEDADDEDDEEDDEEDDDDYISPKKCCYKK